MALHGKPTFTAKVAQSCMHKPAGCCAKSTTQYSHDDLDDIDATEITERGLSLVVRVEVSRNWHQIIPDGDFIVDWHLSQSAVSRLLSSAVASVPVSASSSNSRLLLNFLAAAIESYTFSKHGSRSSEFDDPVTKQNRYRKSFRALSFHLST